MIKWWQDRAALKRARELVKGARKLLRMHRDILPPEQVTEIAAAAQGLDQAVKQGQVAALEPRVQQVNDQLDRAFPRQRFASLRENVEVFLVAAIVAMAVRTFFIQPFKIPTGSMQPTLYGIYPPEPHLLPYGDDGKPSPLRQLVGIAFEGKIYHRYGYRSRGDHIFVDRFTYHFRKPQPGEVVVFDTADIERIPEASRGKFYIKRLVATGGETVQIKPPHVVVNGAIRDSRVAFERIYSQQGGYNGYVLPLPPTEFFRNSASEYQVPPGGLFVLGDNSLSSLDGRYWGAVHENALVGRAVFVYWPFWGDRGSRFGLID